MEREKKKHIRVKATKRPKKVDKDDVAVKIEEARPGLAVATITTKKTKKPLSSGARKKKSGTRDFLPDSYAAAPDAKKPPAKMPEKSEKVDIAEKIEDTKPDIAVATIDVKEPSAEMPEKPPPPKKPAKDNIAEKIEDANPDLVVITAEAETERKRKVKNGGK